MRKFAAPLALLLTSTACTTMEAAPAPVAAAADRMVSPILTSPEAVDTLTHAQPQVARVTHVALDLDLEKFLGAIDLEIDQIAHLRTIDAQYVVSDAKPRALTQTTRFDFLYYNH